MEPSSRLHLPFQVDLFHALTFRDPPVHPLLPWRAKGELSHLAGGDAFVASEPQSSNGAAELPPFVIHSLVRLASVIYFRLMPHSTTLAGVHPHLRAIRYLMALPKFRLEGILVEARDCEVLSDSVLTNSHSWSFTTSYPEEMLALSVPGSI